MKAWVCGQLNEDWPGGRRDRCNNLEEVSAVQESSWTARRTCSCEQESSQEARGSMEAERLGGDATRKYGQWTMGIPEGSGLYAEIRSHTVVSMEELLFIFTF